MNSITSFLNGDGREAVILIILIVVLIAAAVR